MTALELVAMPPAVWAEHLEELSAEECESMASSLSHIIERAALARGYIDGRYLFGTGTHDRGVKAANALRVKVRKALGFAYPAAQPSRF